MNFPPEVSSFFFVDHREMTKADYIHLLKNVYKAGYQQGQLDENKKHTEELKKSAQRAKEIIYGA